MQRGARPTTKIIVDITIIIALGILFRYAYSRVYPCIHVTLDSQGYYDIGKNIFQNPSLKTVINPYRFPLYPVFINAVMSGAGRGGAALSMPDCSSSIETIGLVQTIANLIGMAVFYLIALSLLKRRSVALVISIIQITAINLVAWERSLQSEALAIPLGILFAGLALEALTSPTWKRLLTVSVFSIAGLLLRPSFVMYPAVIFLLIVLWHKTLPVLVRSLTAASIVIVLLMGFVYANGVNWGYYGIQHSSDINILARILQFRLPLDGARNIRPLYTSAAQWEKTPTNSNVFEFISIYNIDVFSAPGLRTLGEFNRTVITRSPVLYAMLALRDIPRSLVASDDGAIPRPNGAAILLTSYFVFRTSQYLFLISLPLILIGWGRMLRKITKEEAAVTLLGTLAYGQILLTVFAGDGMSYARFYSPIQPILFLYIVYWFTKFFARIRAAT